MTDASTEGSTADSTEGSTAVVARGEADGELGVFAVEHGAAGLETEQLVTLDQTRKQRLAEMLILTESAKSAAYAALEAAAGDTADLEHVAAVAALTAGEAYTYITAQTVQLHGGIGFTWDHDAHLYFKRARASAILLGTASELADLIGGQLAAII